MSKYFIRLFLTTTILLFSSYCFANTANTSAPYYGINLYYAVQGMADTAPDSMHGYQVMLSYDPQLFKWKGFDLYFDGGFSQFWVPESSSHSVLNIYSIAPVVRYMLPQFGAFTPFAEISIGLAYLNHTYLDNRNLGIHFAFQDRIGLGTFIGAKEEFSVGLHVEHYSNAGFSQHNSGITAPIVLDVGYRFH